MSSQIPDDAEIDRLFQKYLPKLVKFAEGRIAKHLRPKFDSDDVAVTVLRTVYRRIQEGLFQFEDDAEFWRILVTVAKCRISNKVRHFSAQSRSVKKEVAEAAQAIIAAPEPSPDDAAAFEELLGSLVSQLDEKEQRVFELRMENRPFHEIANLLSISERTARRKMEVIKEKLVEVFYDSQPPKDDD